jgi:hypothetical protein
MCAARCVRARKRFPGQIEPVEAGIAMLESGDDAERLRIMVETAMGLETGIQRPLAGVSKGGG